MPALPRVIIVFAVAATLSGGSAAREPSGRIYVSKEGDGTVSAIDAATLTVLETIAAGTRPRGIQAAPDGRRVYVALSDTGRSMRRTKMPERRRCDVVMGVPGSFELALPTRPY